MGCKDVEGVALIEVPLVSHLDWCGCCDVVLTTVPLDRRDRLTSVGCMVGG